MLDITLAIFWSNLKNFKVAFREILLNSHHHSLKDCSTDTFCGMP